MSNSSNTVYDDSFYDSQVQDSLTSAEIVVPLVLSMIDPPPKSVVDVGCGLGAWLSVFQRNGIKQTLGIDGDHVTRERLMIATEDFLATNLSQPFDPGRTFDLAISLEVGEHITHSNVRNFVHSIANLAPIVLFSAAVPCQGGVNHVNEQWPEYWQSLFAEVGFVMSDPIRKQKAVWGEPRVCYWYRQNMFLLVSRGRLETDARMKELVEQNPLSDLLLLHHSVADRLSGVSPFLRRLPKTIKRRIFHMTD